MRRRLRLPSPVLTALFAAVAAAAVSAPLSAPLSAQSARVRAPAAVTIDSTFNGMDAREIGPAGTSGRVAALAVSPRDERVIYVGGATGGVWKSLDGGYTWTSTMDSVAVNSIGAIGIAPSAPDVVYVGTGEANARNSMGVGRGVWKSTDGGRTWSYLGLPETEHTEAIVVHPTDPRTVWVTALGPAWSDGTERGVFKSTDGGKTWRKVLYVDERTGAFELVMDPSNPEHLLASTWTFRRWPWFFESGGSGSGLWASWDGGETWRRQTEKDGLPAGELGRIGLAFATNDPTVAYALVEAENSALLRSDDGGVSWKSVNAETNVNERAFYYSRIYVDPTNENRVYRVSGDLSRSDDGGRTFAVIAPWSSVHVDHHAFWAFADGKRIATGNDGGVFISNDRGGSWRFVENLPLAQFYHISVDNQVPFHVYGGLQDNGSWTAPSQSWVMPSFAGSNIVNEDWQTIGFGDGFAALADPNDPTLGYSMSQEGYLMRFDLKTGETASIRPPAPDSATKLRFNWNAAIAMDPFDPGVVYFGSQFVHVTRDFGETWSIISPDLTTNNPEYQKQNESGGLTTDATGAENYTTILTLSPSPVEQGVLWVGTDDGNVQLTRDGGKTWTNVVDRIKGVPRGTWVPHVEASKHAAGTAYVVFDNHRRGDWTPYVYRTTDYGRSWQALSPGQIDGFVHTIEEDPVEPNLLFLGTEFGLYFSLDAGQHWGKWTHGGFPAGVPVRALVVHPRDGDLVAGTHGRGAWIIDDVRPLRAMAHDAAVAASDLHLFDIPQAYKHTVGITGPFYFPGDTRFQGENRPYGALISYYVSPDAAADTAAAKGGAGAGTGGEAAAEGGEPEQEGPPWEQAGRPSGGPVTIEILKADSVIRTLKGPAEAGVNRVAWGLERSGVRVPGSDTTSPEPRGPEVVPGTYGVRVTFGDHVANGEVDVAPDPRREKPVEATLASTAIYYRGQTRLADLRATTRKLNETRETLALVQKKLKTWRGADADTRDSLTERTRDITKSVDRLLDRLRLPEDTKGIVADSTVTAKLSQALGEATGTPYAPSPQRVQQLEWALARVDGAMADIEQFYTVELPRYRDALHDAGFELLGGAP